MSWIRVLEDRSYRILKTVYLLIQMMNIASAGVCWMQIDPQTSFCRHAFSINMTREECCNISSVTSVSWTPDEHISRSRLFLLNFLHGDNIKCQRCHTSCATVQCYDGRVCRMKDGLPECLCKPRCETRMKELGPFCGTDGRRYKNYCSLLRRNCMYYQQVNIAYFGKCKKSCKRVECFHGNHCIQDQNGIPHCVSCYDKCPYNIPDNSKNYICGSDGRTYNNTCDLKAAICRIGRSIKVAYRGPCVKNHACSNIYCASNKKCLLDRETGTPTCTDCTNICKSNIYIPICGTDGKTYSSYCQMQKASCERGVVIKTRRAGVCKGSSRSSKSRRKDRRKHLRRKQKQKERNDTGARKVDTNSKIIKKGTPHSRKTRRKGNNKSKPSRKQRKRLRNLRGSNRGVAIEDGKRVSSQQDIARHNFTEVNEIDYVIK